MPVDEPGPVRVGLNRTHPAQLTVRRGLFVNWPVDPADLRPCVPEPLTVDTRDGTAYVGIAPFLAADVRPAGVPRWAGLDVVELNVRTYVSWRGRPGVFFFRIDVGSRLVGSIGRRLSALPVGYAPMRLDPDGSQTTFTHERTRGGRTTFDVRYDPTGRPTRADRGEKTRWLLERYRLYHPTERGVRVASVRHRPWPVRPCSTSIRRCDLLDSEGLPTPTGDPVAHYVHEHELRALLPETIDA